MRNTKDVGDETETKVLAELVTRGYSVAIPFGDNDGYDLVAEIGGELFRVQCKTGWTEDECIRFKTGSKTTVNGEETMREYGTEVDAFAVRCRDTEGLYWVPRADVGKKSTYLRLDEPDIDHPSVNRAAEYAFSNQLPAPAAAEDTNPDQSV
jgi:hypothetical protein